MRRFVRRILKSSVLQRLTAIPRYWRSDEPTNPASSRLEQKVPTPKLLRPFVRPLLPKKQSQEERDRARNKARVAEKNIVAEKKRVAEKQRAAEEQRAAEKQHVAEKQPANVGSESSVARPLESAASVSASSDEAPSVPVTTSIEGTVSAHIHRCEQQLGYQSQNSSLLWEALYCNDPNYHAAIRKGGRLADGNKRLALVGDRVLDLMLTMKWYHTWEDRGNFQHHHDMVLSNKSLDKVCMAAGLQDFVLPIVPSPTRPKPSNPRWSSTIVEAVIGGVYLDQGLDAAKIVARRLKIEVSEDFNDQVRTLLRLAYTHIKPCLDYLRLSSEGLVNQRRESQIEYRVMALGLASANAKCERGVFPIIGLLATVIQLIEQSPPQGVKQRDPRFARASPNDPAQQAVASAPTWSKNSSVRRLRNTVTRTSPLIPRATITASRIMSRKWLELHLCRAEEDHECPGKSHRWCRLPRWWYRGCENGSKEFISRCIKRFDLINGNLACHQLEWQT